MKLLAILCIKKPIKEIKILRNRVHYLKKYFYKLVHRVFFFCKNKLSYSFFAYCICLFLSQGYFFQKQGRFVIMVQVYLFSIYTVHKHLLKWKTPILQITYQYHCPLPVIRTIQIKWLMYEIRITQFTLDTFIKI